MLKLRAREAYFTLRAKTDIFPPRLARGEGRTAKKRELLSTRPFFLLR